MAIKILVVDDEEPLCEILKYNLELEGYEVDVAYSAEEALLLNMRQYSLIFLDIMMEKMSGFDCAKAIKKDPACEFTPIIFCSALSGEDERVRGLNIGADDYITKPFRIREVVARVRSLLRRAAITRQQENNPAQFGNASNGETNTVNFAGITLDLSKKQCFIDKQPVHLTRTEYELALFFLSHRENVYTRKEIIFNIWGHDNDVTDRAIDTNITRLRKKLGKYGYCIATRLGYGYGFKEK